jgi:hypothetical protein
MKFIIANLLVAFCFIGYVEAQAVGFVYNGVFIYRDNPQYEELYRKYQRETGARPTVRVGSGANKPGSNPTTPNPTRQNPTNSSSVAITRKKEDDIDPDVLFDIVPLDQDPAIKIEAKKQKQPPSKAIAPKQNYRYSFSGADCNVFAKTYKGDLIHLDSVSTVSVSIYEAKAPVRRLGHASPVGFTGNIRTVAGSIICVLRDDHPLSEIMDKDEGFHHKHIDDNQIREGRKGNFNSGALFPFDLMLMYKNEVGDALGFSIYNLEIISEGIVTSTNDMITEVVLQFQATHIDQIEKVKPIKPVFDVNETVPVISKSKNLKLSWELLFYGSLQITDTHGITFEYLLDQNRINDNEDLIIDSLGNTETSETLTKEITNALKLKGFPVADSFNSVNNGKTRMTDKNWSSLISKGLVLDELKKSINSNLNNGKTIDSLLTNYNVINYINNNDPYSLNPLNSLIDTNININWSYEDIVTSDALPFEEQVVFINVTINNVELYIELNEG